MGGDGFCCWPTSLHLSALGHDVVIVDNLSGRNIDNELEADRLTPIKPMGIRIKAWQEISGRSIDFFNFDVSKNCVRLPDLLIKYKPDAVIHFAEQRAAPYSMKSSFHSAIQWTITSMQPTICWQPSWNPASIPTLCTSAPWVSTGTEPLE